jgi:hypothetical protein
MLTALDDTLRHQLPTTFDHVGSSDPRFFDRYWFAAYAPDGGGALQLTVGQYPNTNTLDSGVVVLRGTQQYNLRVSRALRPNFDAEVGPVRVVVEEPLQTLRLVVEPNDGPIAGELRWEAVLPPEEEAPHFERVAGRVVQDYARFNQVGRVDGWLDVDGSRMEVADWWGGRDHSWGVRPGIGGNAANADTPRAGSADTGALFYFLFFSTRDLAGHLQIAERGRDRTYLTGLIRARDGLSEARVTDAQLKIELIPGTRRFSQVDAAVVLDDGRSFSLRAEPLGSSIAMPGLGYGGWNDGEGLGKHRGEFHSEWDTWDVAHPEEVVTADGETERPRHRIAPVRVTALRGERDTDVGTGSLTFIARGDLPQYDLA